MKLLSSPLFSLSRAWRDRRRYGLALRWAGLTMFCTLSAGVTARAQILYVAFEGTGAQQVGRLHQINADGSGDVVVGSPFPDVALPTWSHDGAQYAVTAGDPARPNQISRNVYAVTPATGSIQKVSPFEDNLNPFNLAYTYVYAFYKAFSPDRSLMAVYSVYASGAPNVSQKTTPTLQIFRTDGQGGSQALVFMDVARDGVHHGGEGVDWSPLGNLLAFPANNSAVQPTAGGRGEATAIFLAEPVTGGGQNVQLTFPRADRISDLSTGEVRAFGEQDYQPKFSPDGSRVAYVRSFQNVSSFRLFPDPDIQSLRITDGLGSDVEVTRLQPGQYVTTLGWSPDGAQLVFDVGQQASSNGFYSQVVLPETSEIYIIGANGAGLRRLLGPGAGHPAWGRFAQQTPPPAAANPTVSVAAAGGERGGFLLTRPPGSAGAALTVFYHVGSSAIGGSDYETLPGSASFEAGQSEAVIAVTLLPEANRNHKVKLFLDPSPAGDYALGKAKAKLLLSDLP